jgi:hypothetical protein
MARRSVAVASMRHLPMSLLPVTVILGCIVTVRSLESSWLHVGCRLPRVHAVIDTTVGVASLLLSSRTSSMAGSRCAVDSADAVLAFVLGFGGIVNVFAAVTRGNLVGNTRSIRRLDIDDRPSPPVSLVLGGGIRAQCARPGNRLAFRSSHSASRGDDDETPPRGCLRYLARLRCAGSLGCVGSAASLVDGGCE